MNQASLSTARRMPAHEIQRTTSNTANSNVHGRTSDWSARKSAEDKQHESLANHYCAMDAPQNDLFLSKYTRAARAYEIHAFMKTLARGFLGRFDPIPPGSINDLSVRKSCSGSVYDGTSDGLSAIWRNRISSWTLGLLHTSDPDDKARSATFSSDDDFSLAPSKSLFQSIYFSSRG